MERRIELRNGRIYEYRLEPQSVLIGNPGDLVFPQENWACYQRGSRLGFKMTFSRAESLFNEFSMYGSVPGWGRVLMSALNLDEVKIIKRIESVQDGMLTLKSYFYYPGENGRDGVMIPLTLKRNNAELETQNWSEFCDTWLFSYMHRSLVWTTWAQGILFDLQMLYLSRGIGSTASNATRTAARSILSRLLTTVIRSEVRRAFIERSVVFAAELIADLARNLLSELSREYVEQCVRLIRPGGGQDDEAIRRQLIGFDLSGKFPQIVRNAVYNTLSGTVLSKLVSALPRSVVPEDTTRQLQSRFLDFMVEGVVRALYSLLNTVVREVLRSVQLPSDPDQGSAFADRLGQNLNLRLNAAGLSNIIQSECQSSFRRAAQNAVGQTY